MHPASENCKKTADQEPWLGIFFERTRGQQFTDRQMPDNSAQIAKIEAILNTGATSVTTDGTTINYDFAQLRKRLRELKATDPAFRRRRFGQIDLSNS